jgi:adenine-specific DNA methylase
MNKRLIEYDLPLADISEASAREKNILLRATERKRRE